MAGAIRRRWKLWRWGHRDRGADALASPVRTICSVDPNVDVAHRTSRRYLLITLTGQKQTIDISVMVITVDQNSVVVKYRLPTSLGGWKSDAGADFGDPGD